MIKNNNNNNNNWFKELLTCKVIYDELINKQKIIDNKQSLYYLELMELYSCASKTKCNKELVLIQNKIDNMFVETLPNKSVKFKEVIVGISKVIYEVKELLSDLSIDVDYLINSLSINLFKISTEPDGIELHIFINRVIKVLNKNLDNVEQYKLIHYITSSLLIHSNYWSIKLIKHSNKNCSMIVPTDEYFEKFKYESSFISINLPRIIFNENNIQKNVSYSHKNILSSNIKINDKILKNLKNISSVKYEINKDVYNWLINNKDIWMPKFPKFEDMMNLNNGYVYKLIKEISNKIRMYNNTMNIAKLLIMLNCFYFSNYMDWRGRIYVSNEYINYQSNKLSLSLIQFKNGVRIGSDGIKYLKIYGANLYGIGISNEKKIYWIEKHHDKIINLDKNLIFKAKNLLLFVGFCLEYKKCMSHDKPDEYISKFPILIDGTCNGLQHLAAMIGDVNVGINVNLIETDIIQDIYNSIAVKINNNLKLDFTINRSFVKKIIMCVPYNVSSYRAAEYFIEIFNYNPKNNMYSHPDDPKKLISYKELYKLSQNIYNLFYKIHPKMKELVTYFKNIAKLMSEFNCHITWHTPSGLIIQQKYVKFTNNQVNGIGNIRKIALKIPSSEIDSRSQYTSLMPNIIHSLDATNVNLTYERFTTNEKKDFFSIHDCFASHAGNIDYLKYCVKKGFIDIYIKKDFIDNFHNTCLNNLAHHNPSIININYDKNVIVNMLNNKEFDIPIKPNLGDLDINNIMNSEYMVY